MQGGAQQAQRAHLVHDLAVEMLMPVRVTHPRQQALLAVVARGFAHQALFVTELRFQQQRVFPLKTGFAHLGFGFLNKG